jgi:hypothetical protein
MGQAQQVVTQLIVDASGSKSGVDVHVAAMEKAKAASVNAGSATATSFERAQQRWTAALAGTDPVIKAQIGMEQALQRQRQIGERAVQLGIATQKAHETQLENVRQKHLGLITAAQQHASANTVLGRTLVAANDNLKGFAASAGPAGNLLAAMGPGGVAAAIGIGVAVVALHQLVTASITLAERAGKLKDFAETTGFTVIELQALEKAGAQVGVSAESVSKGLERFSVQMAEVKLQTGETYEKLLAINPELARQVATAGSLTKAYELVSSAIKGADLERANQLARAFFGRGGVEQTRLMRAVAEAGGLKGVIADLHEADTITAKQADRWDTLGDKIAENMKAAKQNIASIFTEPVLEGAEKFSKAFLEFTREVKQFGVNDDLRRVMEFFSNPVVRGAIAGALTGALRGGVAGAAVGAVAGGGSAFLFDTADKANAADKARDVTEEIDKLTAARERAIVKLEHLQRMVFADDNPYQANDIRQLNETTAAIARLDARITDLKAKLGTGPLRIHVVVPTAVGPDGADRAAERAGKAQEELRQNTIASYNEMARWMGVIAGAATLAERYELNTRKLAAAKAQGRIDEEQYGRAIAEQKEKLELSLGVANMSAVAADRLAQVREVAAKAGLTDEQTRLAVMIAQQETAERTMAAWKRANPELAFAADAIKDIGLDLAKAALSGGNLFDALIGGLDRLAGKLLDKAFQDGLQALITMDPMMAAKAGVEAAVAIGITLFTNGQKQQKELEKAKAAWEGMADEVRNFNAQADGFDLSPLVTAIQAVKNQTIEFIQAATKAGDVAGAVEVLLSGIRRVNATVDEFVRPKGSGTDAEIGQVNATAKQLIDELDALNRQYGVGFNRTTEILAAATEQVAEILRKAEAVINQRRLAFQDRAFAAANDNSTLEGALAAQERQFQRERMEEESVGNKAVADLLIAQQAEELALRKDFADKAIEETRRQADAQKQIYDDLQKYLQGLKFGALSVSAPKEQFAAAQAGYTEQINLAFSGNTEARASIRDPAQLYLEQARSFLGPSEAYGVIFATVTSQLETLSKMMMGGTGVTSVNTNPDGLSAPGFVTPAPAAGTNSPALGAIRAGWSANDNAVAEEVRALRDDFAAMRNDYRTMMAALAELAADGNEIAADALNELQNLRTDTKQSTGELILRAAAGG